MKIKFPENFKIKIPKKESKTKEAKIRKLPLDKEMATPRFSDEVEAEAPITIADRLFGFK